MHLVRLKKILLKTFVLLLICGSGITGCDKGPQIPELGPEAVILAFGDSLTHGTGAPEPESYPARLEQMLHREVINAGIPGEVTAEGRQRLPELLDRHQPGVLLLCHGGNDILRRLNQNLTVDNLKAMIEQARSRNIPVVLISVPQFGLLLEPAPFYRELAEHYGIPLENGIISDILADRSLKSDRIHPNAEGYRLLAEEIFELLEESGAI